MHQKLFAATLFALSLSVNAKTPLQKNIESTYTKRVDYMMMMGSDGKMHTTIVYVSPGYARNPRGMVEYDSTVDEAYFRTVKVNCVEKTVYIFPAGGVYLNSKLEPSDMDQFKGQSPKGMYFEPGEYPYYIGENPLVGIPCKLKPKFKHMR